jgi:dephospho-CoA kinase
MKVIGITGGIGSGKSTICKIFSLLGVSVYEADLRAKKLMLEDLTLVSLIKSAFGEQSYSGGMLNRDFLAKKVFSDKEELDRINRLVHPAVAKDFDRWKKTQSGAYVLKEAAAMIESGSYQSLDHLINVHASEKVRMARVKARDSFRSEEEILKIMEKQVDERVRIELSDFSISNNGAEMVIPQVLKLHDYFSGATSYSGLLKVL